MRKPQVINNISVEYKNDQEAKEKFINYMVDLLLENELSNLGGDDLNTNGSL